MPNILNITNVQIKKIFKEAKQEDGKIPPRRPKAICSVTFCGGEVVVHNIEIWEGDRGLYIQFPSTKRFITNKQQEKEEITYNTFHPTSQNSRREFEEAIIPAYLERIAAADK